MSVTLLARSGAALGCRDRRSLHSWPVTSFVKCGRMDRMIRRARNADRFFENDSRPIMLFDGVCNMCNGGTRIARQQDRKNNLRYVPLQSEAGKELLQRSGRAPDDISSVVLVEANRSYIKSEAVLKIMEYLDLPFPQLALFLQFVPLFIRDFAYDTIADNRYSIFGRTDSCEIVYDELK